MNDEVKIRVVMDTKDAQAALNALGIGGTGQTGGTAPAAPAAPAAGMSLGKILGIGAGILGAKAILSPLTSPTTGGISDIWGEAMGGYGANAGAALTGDLANRARASIAARKSVEDGFSYSAGTEAIAPQAKAAYDAQFNRNLLRERGVQKFEMDNRFRMGGEMQNVDKTVQSVMSAIADGFSNLGDKILSIFKNHR